ncbi:30S ribosomal protein S15 [Candidatus Falkowbacteria bacterium]|nr:MAG: 30S ribosomal protein S15 [Candidatus Falkowbacteria bacterium]
MLDKKAKQRLINRFKVHETDTGSPQVQIAILSEEITQLTDHLKMHKQDHSSRRGLLRKVGERRRLLRYLQREDEKAFMDIAVKLKLRIAKKMIAEEEERKRIEAEIMGDQLPEEDAEVVVEEK